MTRAGFVAVAGRPNVGKSTFLNAAVGGKVAIVSDRPQTTRRAIRGVLCSGETQLVLVDLPGLQRPQDALTARMASRVEQELAGADAVLLMLNAEQGVGPGDRFIARSLGRANRVAGAAAPVTIAVNKIDRLRPNELVAALAHVPELGLDAEIYPISARTGAGLGALIEHLAALMPAGPFLYAADARTDQPRDQVIAELIREAAIRRTFREVPHALEVFVEDVEQPRAELTRVRALIWVESESQKAILIGAGGRMIKAVGSAARVDLERELGCRVYLDLSVRVRRGWRADDALLDRIGIT